MPLTNLDTTQGNPAFARGPDHNVVRESSFAALAPTIAKAGAELYDAKLGSDAGKLADKVYQAGTKTDGTQGSFADIVSKGESDKAFEPYMERLRELKAANEQGIKSTDAVAITLEAMLKEAANSNPAMYDKLLEKTQQTLGYDPTGTLLRVQERNSNTESEQKETDFRDSVSWYMKQSQVEPTIATERVARYQALIAISDFDNPSKELQSDPVYRTHKLVSGRQAAQDRAATAVSRLNNMNAQKDIAGEVYSTELSALTNDIRLPNLRALAGIKADYNAAILTGHSELAEELKIEGLRLAKETVAYDLGLAQNLSTMNPEFLVKTGLIKTVADVDKFKGTGLYRQAQNLGASLSTSDYSVQGRGYLTHFSNSSAPTASSLVNTQLQGKATEAFMAANPQLRPLVTLQQAGIEYNVGQDTVIGELVDGAIRDKDSTEANDIIEAIKIKLSSIYSGPNEPTLMPTKAAQLLAASLTDSLDNKKSPVYSKEDRVLIATASAAIQSSRDLPVRDQRDLFKKLAAEPNLIAAVVSEVVPDNATQDRRGVILDRLTAGAKAYQADIVDALTEREADGDIDPTTRYVYVSEGNVVARSSNRGVPSKGERASNIMLNELHNSAVTLGILNNPRYADINTFTLDDGTVVEDPMTKLHIVLNTRAYGLKRPSGISDVEYDALVNYIRTSK